MRLSKVFIFSLLLLITSSSCLNNIELSEPKIYVSELEGFILDGIPEEWGEKQKIQLYSNQNGKTPIHTDLNSFFKFAHTGEGLVFYFQIEDDINYVDTIHPWNGDAVEIFLAPYKGSDEIIQFYFSTEFDEFGVPGIKINDGRKDKTIALTASSIGQNQDGIIELEILINLDPINNSQLASDSFAIQVYVDDSDKRGDKEKNRLTWFNANYSSQTSLSYFPATLSPDKEYFPSASSRINILDDTIIVLKTFGFLPEDKLGVYKAKGGKAVRLIDEFSGGRSEFVFVLSENKIDIEKDSLFVFRNGECVSYHDLILSPREYEKIIDPPFYNEIRIFKAKDKFSFPDTASCLLVGSSSIRMWNTVKEDLPELKIIHRGFGGSVSADVLTYIKDIVLPYNASQIVYYEGDNDIPQGVPIDSILFNIKTFVEIVKEENPETEIFIISPKPAIVRMKYWKTYLELNRKLKEFALTSDGIEFVDVASGMFLSDGSLDKSLFLEDNLHMNSEGYKIWAKILRESMSLK